LRFCFLKLTLRFIMEKLTKHDIFANALYQKVMQYTNQVETRKLFQELILDPILQHVLEKVFPYVMLSCVLFILLLIVIIITLAIMIFQIRKSV
jgi:hypothetical protein